MSYTLLAILLLWLGSAIVSAGIDFAYFQDEFPTIAKKDYRKDLGAAWFFGIVFGPLGLCVGFFLSGFAQHGVRWK